MKATPRNHRLPHPHFAPFGEDWFGRKAEAFARAFGTPTFLIGQTVLVAIWIAVNAVAAGLRWDPYPFILLNLAFSTQAAYAAPLILLAQTRQAERDRILALHDAHDRVDLDRRAERWEELAARRDEQLRELLDSNRALAELVRRVADRPTIAESER